MRRFVHGAATSLVLLSLSAPASAQDDQVAPGVTTNIDEEARVKTMFLAGLGLLALPAADVCPFTQADCEPGETGLALSLHALGEIYDIAFGAGITFAFGLKPGEAVDPDGTLLREHGRSYFLVESVFRYYLPELGSWHTWVGGTAGAAIVNDSWTTLEDREPYDDTAFVGPRAVTLGTEGIALGIGVGGYWLVTDTLLFGTHIKYANWIFPGARAETPVGDSASLAGRVDVIDVGLTGGFRIPL